MKRVQDELSHRSKQQGSLTVRQVNVATALHCLGRPSWHAAVVRYVFCLGVSYCEDEVGFIFVVVTRQEVHPRRKRLTGSGQMQSRLASACSSSAVKRYYSCAHFTSHSRTCKKKKHDKAIDFVLEQPEETR